MKHTKRALQAAAPVVVSDIPQLPPMEQWFKVTAGIDLQAAINEHKVLYFPSGNYRAPAPLQLKADTVLIGLHVTRTTLSPIVSPKGGATHVSGMGFAALAGVPNILWQSGEKSMLDDFAFTGGGGGRGGRGAPGAPGAPAAPGGAGRAPAGETPSQLVVSEGGGGIIRNVRLEGGSPPVGLRVENTSTRGQIYQFSNEHHNRIEEIGRAHV